MPDSGRAGRILVSALMLVGWCATARAQAPSIAGTSPRAVTPGGSVDLTLRGGALAGATLWSSFPCEATLAPDIADNGQKADQVVYRVKLAPEVSVGMHAVRVTTPGGVSAPVLVAVDDLPSVAQDAANLDPAKAQLLTLPVAVDGTVAALARNYYKFRVEGGQRLSLEVLSRRLGSALDPMIRLLDADGREITYSDDEAGLSADSQICHTFDAPGDYMLEVRDIQYRGGDNFFYRLRIGDFPCVTVPYPMGVKRGSQATIGFAGPSVDDVEPLAVTAPADAAIGWINVGAKRTGGQSSALAVLALGNADEFLETEPNNDADKSNRVTLGATINGRLDQPQDVDRFIVPGKAGQAYSFTAITRRQGSPADLLVRLLKADGSQVVESEDAGENDAQLNYTFPDDGEYTLVVRDLSERGGSAFAYRIEVAPTDTGFSLIATADRLNVPAGGVALVTVNSVRRGYNGPIAVALSGLPEKLTSVPTVVGPGQNSAVLTVRSAPDAVAGQPFSVRVTGTAKIGETDYVAKADVTAALKGAFNNMPNPPLALAEDVELAVAPKPPFTLRTEPATITFGRLLSGTVKIIAERQEGYDEPIALSVTPEKGAVPDGIAPALKPIEKGQNEVEVAFSATDKAPLGEFTGVIVGTMKKGDANLVEPATGVTLKLDEPFRLRLDMGEAKVAKGGSLAVKAIVERNPAFSGAVALAVENLPAGVATQAVEIAADQSEVEIMLTANADAQAVRIDNLTVKGTAKVGEANLVASAAPATLRIE